MEREEYCKLAIKLLQEELDGKKIEVSDKGLDVWSPLVIGDKGLGLIVYDFEWYDYRIKPEKKLVPFTWDDREFLMGKIIKSKSNDIHQIITLIIHAGINHMSYQNLFEEFTFLDSSPCGKEVEG